VREKCVGRRPERATTRVDDDDTAAGASRDAIVIALSIANLYDHDAPCAK
jgi:hypothetical protein